MIMIVIAIAIAISTAAVLAGIAREEVVRLARREEELLLALEALERGECPYQCGVCRICEAEEEAAFRRLLQGRIDSLKNNI